MVFFTCNHCGESVKKPAVEKHYSFKCRGLLKYVSCMDCQKDFRGDEYSGHTRCITEAEKYSGKDYVAKEPKNTGQKKQESWMDIIRSILDTKEYNLSNPIRSAFQRLQTVDNVPRKKSKFQNFVSNCMRMRKDQSEEVWGILEKELDKMKKPVAPPVSVEPKKEPKEEKEPQPTKTEEAKTEETKAEEEKHEEAKPEEAKPEETKPEEAKTEDVKTEAVKAEVFDYESFKQREKRRIEREMEFIVDQRPLQDLKFNNRGELKLDDDPDEDISADQYEIRRVKKSKRRKVDKEIQNTIEQDEEKEIMEMVFHMTTKSKKHREPVVGEPKKRKSKKPEAAAAAATDTATAVTDTAAAKTDTATEAAENEEGAAADQEGVVSTTTPDDFKFALVMVFTLRKYGNSMKLDKLKRKVQRMFCAKRGLTSLNEKQQQKFDKRFDRYLKKCNFKVEHNVVSIGQMQSKTQKPPRSVSQ